MARDGAGSRWTSTGVRIDDGEKDDFFLLEHRQEVDRRTGKARDGATVIHFSTERGEAVCGQHEGTPIDRAAMLDAQSERETTMCEECARLREQRLNDKTARADGGGVATSQVGVGAPVVQAQGVGATALLDGHVVVNEDGSVQLSPLALAGAGIGVAVLAGLVGAWLS